MILNGHCDKVNKDIRISVDIINANSLEDVVERKPTVGRIKCEYSSAVGCTGKNCSVLIQNGYKN